MKLYPTRIYFSDTCVTYALKRTGMPTEEIYDSRYLENYFRFIPFENWENIPIGSILCWKTDIDYSWPFSISESGELEYRKANNKFHVAVLENDGYITDLHRRDVEVPSLRKREKNQLKSNPTHYLNNVSIWRKWESWLERHTKKDTVPPVPYSFLAMKNFQTLTLNE